jgi:hypothetical protein
MIDSMIMIRRVSVVGWFGWSSEHRLS